MLPRKQTTILGHKVSTSFASGLEHQLLKEYKTTIKKLPILNTMIR